MEGSEAAKDGLKTQTGSGAVKNRSTLSSGFFAPPYESYQGPIYSQDVGMFSTLYPDFQRLQLNQLNGYDNQMFSMNNNYSLPIENQFQYVPIGTIYQGHPYEFQYQDFQYFVVIDFEATCDKESNPHPQEIIEFPSVLVNSWTGQLEASFQTYVRPAYHQHLSDFCKELTGIQQVQVDRGVPLTEALLMHDKWLEEKGIKQTNFAVVTWSDWDCRVMLESECRFKKIRKPPYFNRWINLKVPFNEVFRGVRCNLKEAVQLAGLAWEGRAHCGLDDARNTARLLSYLMYLGFKFSITNSLMCHSAEQSLPLQQSPGYSLTPSHSPYQLKRPPVRITPSLTARVEPGKDLQKSVSTGLKVAKAQPKIQGRTKAGSPVLGTGAPKKAAYDLTPRELLFQPAKSGNPS